MDFRPKRIFLADDDDKFREKIKTALVEAGHQIVIETNSGDKALSLVDEAVAREVEVAILDCHMPYKEDGEKIAGALNSKIPTLIIASISSSWSGVWLDPNYDKDHPYHTDLSDYDVNGRKRYKKPDLSLSEVGWNPERFAQLIGTTEFSLRNGKELEGLPKFLEWMQGVQRSRGERK